MNQDMLIKNTVFILLCNTGKDFNDWGMPKPSDNKVLNIEVNCTINGIEVDFVRLVHEFNSSFEGRVKEAVQEIVKTQLQDLIESMSKIARSIGNTEKELQLSNIYFDK
ncbi:MAG: hypothetical protein RLZZ139_779 [Cyanobacteriota bacterium]